MDIWGRQTLYQELDGRQVGIVPAGRTIDAWVRTRPKPACGRHKSLYDRCQRAMSLEGRGSMIRIRLSALTFAILALAALAASRTPASAEAGDDFYKGKQLSV